MSGGLVLRAYTLVRLQKPLITTVLRALKEMVTLYKSRTLVGGGRVSGKLPGGRDIYVETCRGRKSWREGNVWLASWPMAEVERESLHLKAEVRDRL